MTRRWCAPTGGTVPTHPAETLRPREPAQTEACCHAPCCHAPPRPHANPRGLAAAATAATSPSLAHPSPFPLRFFVLRGRGPGHGNNAPRCSLPAILPGSWGPGRGPADTAQAMVEEQRGVEVCRSGVSPSPSSWCDTDSTAHATLPHPSAGQGALSSAQQQPRGSPGAPWSYYGQLARCPPAAHVPLGPRTHLFTLKVDFQLHGGTCVQGHQPPARKRERFTRLWLPALPAVLSFFSYFFFSIFCL